MSSDFPTSLPGAKTDFDSDTAVASSLQNAQGEDINAIAAKVGVTDSTVTTSVDYWIKKGWTPINETLTWATYKTTTATGDLTGKYQKGDKIKLNQALGGTYALDLEEGSSQYAWVADNADVSVTGDISIEAWIKMEQLASVKGSDHMLVTKYTLQDNKRSYAFLINTSDDKLAVHLSDNGEASSHVTIVGADKAFTADDVGKWIHVAVVVDISEASATFYVNGVSWGGTASLTDATSIHDNDSQFNIGCRISSGGAAERFFDGLIKDVRLWNDIRTAAEIRNNRFTQLAGNEAGLVGYWKFENDATDSCKSSDLTLAGGAGYVEDDPDITEYFYLVGITYSSPNTTFTFTGGSDYVLGNNAIVSPFYSKVENPQGFPTYFNFIPTITYSGGTQDPTSLIINNAYFYIRQKCLFFLIKSTLTRGSGDRTAILFTAPPVANIIASLNPFYGFHSITGSSYVPVAIFNNTASSIKVQLPAAMSSDGYVSLAGSYFI